MDPSPAKKPCLPSVLRESVVKTWVEVEKAQQTRVMKLANVLSDEDISLILSIQNTIAGNDEARLANNPQNANHRHKQCTFMNRSPEEPFRNRAPHVLRKVLRAGMMAFHSSGWDSDATLLGNVSFKNLQMRVVECWEYSVGGKLDEDLHFDPGSILTIVTLLNEGFEGGLFRTFEADGTHLEHLMQKGDVICFLSHKYHNVTEVTKGTRRSMVIELWEGGIPNFLR